MRGAGDGDDVPRAESAPVPPDALTRGRDCSASAAHAGRTPASDWREWAQTTTSGRCLDHLVVDGRTVVEHGRLLTADLADIESKARDEAARLWTRMRKN